MPTGKPDAAAELRRMAREFSQTAKNIDREAEDSSDFRAVRIWKYAADLCRARARELTKQKKDHP